MNRPLRRVSLAIAALFFALLVNATWIQVGDAKHLDHRTDNPRPLYERLTTHRGDIRLVDGTVVAESNKVAGQTSYVRSYPQGSLYADVLGWAGAASTGGIERAEDDLLAGNDDRLAIHNFTDVLSGKEKQGGNVVLTLDKNAQTVATQALQAALGNTGKRGAVVAIDVHTGAVKALVGLPTYDPNKLSSNTVQVDETNYNALLKQTGNPLVAHAISDRFPPGSMFKMVDSAAALASGKYTPEKLLDAPPSYTPPLTSVAIHNFNGELCGSGGKESLADALATSCNTAFAKLGVALGQTALQDQAAQFGIGQDPGTLSGLAIAKSQFVAPNSPALDPPSLAQSAIGQYNVALTPLQAAEIVQTIANNGQLLAPYVVDSETGPDNQVLSDGKTQPKTVGTPLDPKVVAQLTQMMVGVTTKGTAAGVFTSLGFPVAGKTGTAQHSTSTQSLPPHSWFAGFGPVPADTTAANPNPEYAVVAFVEDSGTAGESGQGATVAAPIVAKVLHALLPNGAGK